MIRTVKNIRKGGAIVEETITLDSQNPTPAYSVEAWKDLNITLRTCLDAGLLRGARDAPRKVTIEHTQSGWVFAVHTTMEEE